MLPLACLLVAKAPYCAAEHLWCLNDFGQADLFLKRVENSVCSSDKGALEIPKDKAMSMETIRFSRLLLGRQVEPGIFSCFSLITLRKM